MSDRALKSRLGPVSPAWAGGDLRLEYVLVLRPLKRSFEPLSPLADGLRSLSVELSPGFASPKTQTDVQGVPLFCFGLASAKTPRHCDARL